jgi:hypothetical protein
MNIRNFWCKDGPESRKRFAVTVCLIRSISMLAALLMASGVSQAALIITAVESAGNVVFSTSGGTLNTTGLSQLSVKTDGAEVDPAAGILVLGGGTALYTLYSGVTGPGFGSGSSTTPDSATGSRLFLGPGVVGFGGSGSSVGVGASSMTFNSATFLSLGITPDTYTWNWTGDSVTLNANVPIPPAVWLFGSAIGLLGWMRRKKV